MEETKQRNNKTKKKLIISEGEGLWCVESGRYAWLEEVEHSLHSDLLRLIETIPWKAHLVVVLRGVCGLCYSTSGPWHSV